MLWLLLLLLLVVVVVLVVVELGGVGVAGRGHDRTCTSVHTEA